MSVSDDVKIAVLEEKIKNLENNINIKYDSLEKELDQKANKTELQPVKILVYGFVGTILIGVLGALINLVIVSNGSTPIEPSNIVSGN